MDRPRQSEATPCSLVRVPFAPDTGRIVGRLSCPSSETGRRFLEEHNRLRAVEMLRSTDDRVETAPAIERYESAPCPDR